MTLTPRTMLSQKWLKIFNLQNSQLSKSVQYTNGSKNMLRLNMQWWHLISNGNTRNWTSSLVFLRLRITWSSRVFVVQKMAKKVPYIYNAHAQLLFCLLNLLFGDVLFAIIIMVCLSSLWSTHIHLLGVRSLCYLRKFGGDKLFKGCKVTRHLLAQITNFMIHMMSKFGIWLFDTRKRNLFTKLQPLGYII